MAKCTRAVKVYLHRMFGAPEQVFMFPKSPEVAVVKWSARRTGDDVAFYVTVGACEWHSAAAPTHRQEYFVGLDPEHDSVAAALAAIGSGPFRTGEPVEAHSAIEGRQLWAGADLDGFLLTGPDEDVLPTLRTKRAHVAFVQVVPSFAAERRYFEDHGEDALLASWQRIDVPYWDPMRPELPLVKP